MARSRALGGLLALVMLSAAHGAGAASAADGLPPGVRVPSWARGQKVRFEPVETHNPHRAVVGRPAASNAKAAPLASSPPRLRYHGGLVQNEPRLVLVFMGSQWENHLALRHELEATAESLPGSDYQKILTQYSGLDGPISSPLVDSPVIETYNDNRPATQVDSAAASQEGVEVIKLTGAGQDTNATYAVLPAPGTAEPEEFVCGFHEQYGSGPAFTPGPSIAVIMDTETRPGCVTSKTLTHEYAESVTDPGSSAWNTGEGTGDEIADICNDLGAGRLADGALVSWLWDDSKDACEIEDDDPEPVPIGPYADTSRRNPSLEGSTNETVESEALEASIYPCDLEAHYYFEYGTTTAYGGRTPESTVPATWGAVKANATITGLQHSIPYHWRVVVKTSDGLADGVDHEFSIPYYVELKEGNATNVGLSEATLNGEVRPVGVEAKYYFEYGTTEAYGSRTPEVSAGSGSSFVKVSSVLAGLQMGTVYHFRLIASSSRGTTTGEDQRFETYGGKPAVETSPGRFIRYTEAELSAKVDAKGVPTTFYFEYGTTLAYGQTTSEQSSERVGAKNGTATVIGLEPGTVYHFRIVATNSYGTSYGADESFSTPQEPLVETTAPSAVGYDTAALSGTINPHGSQVEYYFEYGYTPEYGLTTAQASAGSGNEEVEASYAISGLGPGVTYHYRLVAVYGSVKQYGGDMTFTTVPPPLVEPIVTPPSSPLPPAAVPAPVPPVVDPAPIPTPTTLAPSLSLSRRGSSLTVVLWLNRAVARVAVDATVPFAQLGESKPRGRSRTVAVARMVRDGVKAGRSKFRLALNATGRRALRRRRLRLTVTATISLVGGERQKLSRMFKLG